jgi:hypothetical protein
VIFLGYLPYHAHRQEESFETHVWMLKTLLGRVAESERHLNTFHEYIIAVCFKKMAKRMENKEISVLYFHCLTNLTTSQLSNLKLPSEKQKADHGDRDLPFARDIPLLAKIAQTKIPNLQRAAEQQPIEIYNENTCIEFHRLLCEFLKLFKDCLNKLGRRTKGDLPGILEALKSFRIMGQFLRTMVRSSAIETHLRTIAPLLDVNIGKMWTPLHKEDDDFADFQSLKPYSTRKGKPLSPWESYRDWLMLMVHYFDAADVLALHVKKLDLKTNGLSIKILVPPLPNKIMLPWEKLLENERLFPAQRGKPSGKEFADFLNKTPRKDRIDDAIDSAKVLQRKLKSNDQQDDMIDALAQKVKGCSSNCDDVKEISEKILTLKHSDLPEPAAEMETVMDMLNVLSERGSFHKQLKRDPLRLGNNSPGTYHCEAYIASLLALWDSSGEHASDIKERLNMQSEECISQIESVLDEIKARHAVMHHLNLG